MAPHGDSSRSTAKPSDILGGISATGILRNILIQSSCSRPRRYFTTSFSHWLNCSWHTAPETKAELFCTYQKLVGQPFSSRTGTQDCARRSQNPLHFLGILQQLLLAKNRFNSLCFRHRIPVQLLGDLVYAKISPILDNPVHRHQKHFKSVFDSEEKATPAVYLSLCCVDGGHPST